MYNLTFLGLWMLAMENSPPSKTRFGNIFPETYRFVLFYIASISNACNFFSFSVVKNSNVSFSKIPTIFSIG